MGRFFAGSGFIFFLLWATRGHFWTPLTAFFPQMHLLYGAAFLFLLWLFLFHRERLRSAMAAIVAWRYEIFPLVAFLVPLGIAIFFFRETPHPIDAAHYRWMARLFLSGHLYLPLPPFYEHLAEGFMVMHGDRCYSLFPPGFPVVLMPFAAFDFEFWLNPLLNGLAVLLTGIIAERITDDRRVAAFAMLFTTMSAFFLFLSATLFPHQTVLALTLLAVLVAVSGPLTPLRAALVGLCVALIVPVRPQDGLFTAAAVACFLLVRHGRPRPATALSFVMPLVAGAGTYLYYQYLLTGEWLTYPQDLFFAITEENRFCHHIGLGTGCRRLTKFILPAEGLTMTHGFFVTMTRLSELLFKATLHPLVWLFIFPALWRGARKHAAALFLFVALVGGYYLFHQDGNFYGPRYYCSAIPLLLVAAAHGFVIVYDRVKVAGRVALLALPLSGMLFTVGIIMPSLGGQQSAEWYTANERMRALVTNHGFRDSVIFVPFRFGHGYSFANPLTLQEVPPHDRKGNLYLNSIPLLDARTAAYLLKNGYRAAWQITEEDGRFAVKPLKPFGGEDILIEAEYKFKPLSGKASYGFLVGNFEDDPDFQFIAAKTPLSGYFGYGVRFGAAGEVVWWDTVHDLPRSGHYRIAVAAVATPCGGETEFLVDGVSLGTFPAGAESQRSVQFVAETYLARGEHRFSLKPLEDDRCLVIDRITLVPQQSKGQ